VRTEQLHREFDLELRHSVFPLHPQTPEEGLELAELFAGSGWDLAAMLARLQAVAAEVGLPLGERTRTYNSRRAQELGKWAEEQGRGEAFHSAVYRAYFVAGCNIALPAELAAIAAGVGLAADEARRVLETGSHAAAVDADWRRARALGVRAVPTFRYGGRQLVGFTPYPALRRLIAG
jgi:predicted DsbA family dithiol-disulfide isomerase